jgi:alkyldihydroxyacetonephosphate synthase
VLDESDPALVAATMAIVDQECQGEGGESAGSLDTGVVDRWLGHRNDVSALVPLWRNGIVVDTAEVAGRWATLATLADEVPRAIRSVAGTLVASVHQSHAYTDGACLYFTFGGRNPDPDDTADGVSGAGDGWSERYYREVWDTLTAVVQQADAAISHHHGIGLNRARFMGDALGAGHRVLESIKAALDPGDVLNPGKLGLRSARGPVPWS